MSHPKRSAPEEKLVVVNFRTKNAYPALNQWRESHNVGVAESCARQVWYGTAETFEGFPMGDRPGINILSGQDAYAFLIKLMTGMDSPKKGETNIKGDFFRQWDAFKEENPVRGKELDPVFQHLKADSRAIQNQVLDGFKIYEHGLAARDLSGQKKGSTVLLVGHLSRHGNMGEYGEKIARSINNRAYRPDNLVVTHPDPQVAKKIMSELQALKARKIIDYKLEKIAFEDLPIGFEVADYSYIDIPMGQDEAADEFIIHAWQSRQSRDNILTHMRGNPTNKAFSDARWEEGNLDNYISPEDIRKEMFERGRYNKELSAIAEIMFVRCAEARMVGKSLSDRAVRDIVKQLRAESSNDNIQASVETDRPTTAMVANLQPR